MNRNSIIGLVILLAVIGGIVYLVYHNRNSNNSVTPNLSISSINQTQNADGTKVTAHPKDTLVYTLMAENPSDKVITGYVMEVSIAGITNVATLIDAQGANYNSSNNSLIWTPLDIAAGGNIQKQFTVRVKDQLPANSADKVIKVTFNNELDTTVDYASKTGTNTNTNTARPGSGSSYKAPTTGIPGWISFFLACFMTFGVLLFRVAHKLGRPTN